MLLAVKSPNDNVWAALGGTWIIRISTRLSYSAVVCDGSLGIVSVTNCSVFL